FAELHDGALAELLFNLRESEIQAALPLVHRRSSRAFPRLTRGGSAPNSLALSIPNIRSRVNQPRESAHFTEPDFLDLAVDRARGVKSALHDKQRLNGLGPHRHPAQLLEDRRQIGRGPRSP